MKNLDLMQALPLELREHLQSFNGTLDSLKSFFAAVGYALTDYKKIAEQNEMRFRKLLEQASDGIVLLNAQGLITFMTPSVLNTFGYTDDDLLATSGFDIVHPDDVEMLRDFISALETAPDKTIQVCYRVKTKGGDWKWVRSNVTNMLQEKCIESFVFNYADVTDEINLRRQKEFDVRNRDAMINSTSDLMWSLDREMKLLAANCAFISRIKKETGMEMKSGDDLLNPVLFSPGRRNKWRERYERALAGETFHVDDHFDDKSAGWWEETWFYPIWENREVIGVACFLHDITEAKTASELERQSQELMLEAQSIANFGSWEFYFGHDSPEKFRAFKWSDELFRIFGHKPQSFEVTLEKFYRHIHPEDFNIMQGALQRAFMNNASYEAEYRILRSNGEIRWIRSRGRIVLEESGRPLKMVGTAQDVTDKKIAEQERNKIIEDLLQRNKDLEQFAYILSHNLRAPVVQIQGLVDVFRLSHNDKQVQNKCAEGLSVAVKRLDDVISDINYILQVKKEISEKKTRVNLHSLVEEVKESIRHYLNAQEGIIYSDFEACPELFTLKGYLYSIFYNLITNSLKYRRRDALPVIQISSSRQGSRMIIMFKDNGLGIDLQRHSDKIFGLYKRFHNDIEGKGMGLFMVKTQVETLGGRIRVDSEVNAGTRFIIELET